MFRTQHKLFQDSGIHYPIYDFDLPFSEYITTCKSIIARQRQDLTDDSDLIINANTPYELRPAHKAKYGALLIHGLLDTPFIMKDIGMHLQSQGLLVRSILLPGHGTVPGSLLNVDYQDWLQALRYGINSLAKEVEHIYLVGFSTGASLSIYQALQNPAHLVGLILFSPAFKINTRLDFVTNWHRAISWMNPRAQWLHISKEIDYTKYRSVCFNAAYQVYLLAEKIKKLDHHKQLPFPIFMALSYEDKIVSSKTSIEYFNFYSNPLNKMILYKKHPTHYTDARIEVRPSTYPEWNIESFSHISIPVSPDNPHYGKQGDYPIASHIEEKKPIIYCALNRPQKFFYDRLHHLKLIKYQRQRLTFNPDFHFLTVQLDKFIKSIGE